MRRFISISGNKRYKYKGLKIVYPVLTEKEKTELEGEIKDQEIVFVLGKMENNKSPGSDGFSAELF